MEMRFMHPTLKKRRYENVMDIVALYTQAVSRTPKKKRSKITVAHRQQNLCYRCHRFYRGLSTGFRIKMNKYIYKTLRGKEAESFHSELRHSKSDIKIRCLLSCIQTKPKFQLKVAQSVGIKQCVCERCMHHGNMGLCKSS